MRTQNEIIERCRERRTSDPMGFEVPYYLAQLTAESAKELLGSVLNVDTNLSDWAAGPAYASDDEIKAAAVDYMEFAWDKANDCRGISAYRSMCHYTAWLWLLGVDWCDELEDYEYYGKPELIRICKYLGLDPAQWDDGIRTNDDGG